MPSQPPAHAEPTPLARKLAARIAADGPVSVHDYMEACLYDPEYGYYRKQDPLGRGGDFITAPEISQVFGELIGLWAGESWRLMGQPAPVRLIELGPGRGTLMADALRALRVLPAFLKSVTIHLVETSRTLRTAQEAALAGAPCPVFWHETIEEVPAGATIAIANEFIDCLPVRQFVFDEAAQTWHERMVTFGEGNFRFELSSDEVASPSPLPLSREGRGDSPETLGTPSQQARPAPSPLAGEGGGEGELSPLPEDGAIIEVRPRTSALLQEFAARAAAAPFAALIVDYGYTKPSLGDTLQAVRQHRFAGLFEAPGEADLTAHVHFADLLQKASELNLTAPGPMPMGEWLLRLGLEVRVRQLLSRATQAEAADIQSRVSRLVDPKQMGVLFKALVLTGGGTGVLPPF
jgi:NADH dehydrogenase [ubiquinone] 1 alpha subcomplex assembly factor 7